MSYLKPNTKKAIKLAAFVKGFTGTIGASVFFADYPRTGFFILAIGAIANEIINFLSDETDPNTPI